MSARLLRCLAVTTALAIAPGGPLSSVHEARADHDGTCHPGGGNLYNPYITVGFFETLRETSLTLSLGRGRAKPRARVRDGTSNTFLVGEKPPTPTCADLDGDGLTGVVEIAVVVYGGRPSARAPLPIVVVPTAGEIDGPGWHPATAFVDDGGEIVEIEGRVLAVSAARR
jgi:hypothetical protein